MKKNTLICSSPDLEKLMSLLSSNGWIVKQSAKGTVSVNSGKKQPEFHVQFVENCSPRAMSFNTKEDLEEFTVAFEKLYGNNDESWIDLICRGSLVYAEKTLGHKIFKAKKKNRR